MPSDPYFAFPGCSPCNPCLPPVTGYFPPWEIRIQFHPGPMGFPEYTWASGAAHTNLYTTETRTLRDAAEPPEWDVSSVVTNDTFTGAPAAARSTPAGTITATTWNNDGGGALDRGSLSGLISGTVDLEGEISTQSAAKPFPTVVPEPYLDSGSGMLIAPYLWSNVVNGGGWAESIYSIPPTPAYGTAGTNAATFSQDYGSNAVNAWYFDTTDASNAASHAGLYFNRYIYLCDVRYSNKSGSTKYAHFYNCSTGSKMSSYIGSSGGYLTVTTPGTYDHTSVLQNGRRYVLTRRTNGYIRVTNSATPP